MRIRSLSAVLVAALFAPAVNALPAIVVDNFEEGDFSVVDLAPPVGTPTLANQSGLSGTNTVGGVRLVRSTADAAGSATAALVTTGGDDGALLSSVGDGSFAFIYDGVANNLSEGSAGVLNLDLSTYNAIQVDISTALPTGVDMRLTLWDGVTTRSTAFRPVTNGANLIDLDGGLLALNLGDIRAIQISLQDVTTTMPATILGIAIVPEPTTALLLSLGLAGIAIARKR
jgi:PEP-CTERM motif